jgi:hypothetical protein
LQVAVSLARLVDLRQHQRLRAVLRRLMRDVAAVLSGNGDCGDGSERRDHCSGQRSHRFDPALIKPRYPQGACTDADAESDDRRSHDQQPKAHGGLA